MATYTIPASIRFLLFDMDGTLVDTEPIGPATFLEQLSHYGVESENDDYELFIKVWKRDGTDVHENDFLTAIVEKYGINVAAETYIREFFELYEVNITKAKALTGVDTFLANASKEPALKLAVVTASKLSQVQAVLANHNWAHYFDAIVSEEDISHHKPDPEPFIVGMKKLGAANDQTIIFEDSKNGSVAGGAANCTVIGIRAGNASEQDLSSANVIVDSFEDVLLPINHHANI